MNRILFAALLLAGFGLSTSGCSLIGNSGDTDNYCDENPLCEGEAQAGPEEAFRADSAINGAVDPASD